MADSEVTIFSQSLSTQKSTCSDDESPEQELQQLSPGETNVNADKGIFFII